MGRKVNVTVGYLPTFPDPVGQTAGVWTGVFQDDFTSSPTVTDATTGLVNFGGPTWKAWYPETPEFLAQAGGAHTNNPGREQEYYATSALSVSSGVLSMTASHVAQGGLPYTSGMVCTYPNFTFKYGYIEARCRVTAVGGTWPAFWLACAETDGSGNLFWPPEVDIFEQFGTDIRALTTTWKNAGGTGALNLSTLASDATAWHVYGCKWTSTRLNFYVDGSLVLSDTTAADIPSRFMYVLLDLAIDGNQTFSASNYPTSFQADYVRVWQ